LDNELPFETRILRKADDATADEFAEPALHCIAQSLISLTTYPLLLRLKQLSEMNFKLMKVIEEVCVELENNSIKSSMDLSMIRKSRHIREANLVSLLVKLDIKPP
jgi:hypothetical protein